MKPMHISHKIILTHARNQRFDTFYLLDLLYEINKQREPGEDFEDKMARIFKVLADWATPFGFTVKSYLQFKDGLPHEIPLIPLDIYSRVSGNIEIHKNEQSEYSDKQTGISEGVPFHQLSINPDPSDSKLYYCQDDAGHVIYGIIRGRDLNYYLKLEPTMPEGQSLPAEFFPILGRLLRSASVSLTKMDIRDTENHVFLRERNRPLVCTLTGLPNKAGMIARFISEWYNAIKTGSIKSFVVAFLDMDHLKRLNELWSHEIAGQVIIRIGQALNVYFPGSVGNATVGDEFLIYLQEEATSAKSLFVKFLDDMKGFPFEKKLSLFSIKEDSICKFLFKLIDWELSARNPHKTFLANITTQYLKNRLSQYHYTLVFPDTCSLSLEKLLCTVISTQKRHQHIFNVSTRLEALSEILPEDPSLLNTQINASLYPMASVGLARMDQQDMMDNEPPEKLIIRWIQLAEQACGVAKKIKEKVSIYGEREETQKSVTTDFHGK
jgi:GGDEF domain-containing protein